MKKIIITIIAAIMMMTMVSCNEEPKSETTDDNTLVLSTGVEVTFGEVELGPMIPCGGIVEEEDDIPYVSDEYLAEVEFNSQTNRW